MAAKVLLPGIGGMYTSETISTGTGTIGADTIDCQNIGQLLVTVNFGASAPAGSDTVTLQQSLTPEVSASFADLGTAITLTATGVSSRFDITDGPFGVIRLKWTLTQGTATVNIAGWPVQPNK